MARIYISNLFLVIFFIISLYNTSYPVNLDEGINVKFANNISAEHYSGILYNDIRTEHSTISRSPEFVFNEMLQIFLIFNHDESEISTSENSCMNITSTPYFAFNFIYSHHENYAIRTGAEMEIGFGNYKNPFISCGVGVTYFHDMVFDYTEKGKLNIFFNLGYMDDSHLFVDFSGPLNDSGVDHEYKSFYDIDVAIGYKKLIPLLFRADLFVTQTESKIDDSNNFQYEYYHEICFLHLQYYGENTGFSAGYIYNKEWYDKAELNADRTDYVNTERINSKKSHGGGLTVYRNNIASSLNIFGEFHILADEDIKWMTLSKFGVKVFF